MFGDYMEGTSMHHPRGTLGPQAWLVRVYRVRSLGCGQTRGLHRYTMPRKLDNSNGTMLYLFQWSSMSDKCLS